MLNGVKVVFDRSPIKKVITGVGFPFRGDYLEGIAMWDTGAERSFISEKMASRLGLVPTSEISVAGVNGNTKCNTYKVDALFYGNEEFLGLAMGGLEVGSTDSLFGFDFIVGMDIISRGDFHLTKQDDKTVFEFYLK